MIHLASLKLLAATFLQQGKVPILLVGRIRTILAGRVFCKGLRRALARLVLVRSCRWQLLPLRLLPLALPLPSLQDLKLAQELLKLVRKQVLAR